MTSTTKFIFNTLVIKPICLILLLTVVPILTLYCAVVIIFAKDINKSISEFNVELKDINHSLDKDI